MRAFLLPCCVLLLCAISGCRTITYSDKAGNKLEIKSLMWDTSIGSMAASNGTESLAVSNYAAKPDQQALQLADDVAKGLFAASAKLGDKKSNP